MEQYASLAQYYDILAQDIPYDSWISLYERTFKRYGQTPKIILDLGCGTGSVSVRFAQKGYEVIGVDSSSEMLSVAAQRSEKLQNAPLYIRQKMQKLDLFGTVDAVVSCMDSLNYITVQSDFARTVQRVHLFLNPKGLFLFDMKSVEGLRALNDKIIIKEDKDVFCVWESSFSEKSMICSHFLDIFSSQGELWKRTSETHKERAYLLNDIMSVLQKTGFSKIQIYAPFTFSKLKGNEDRWFFVAQKA